MVYNLFERFIWVLAFIVGFIGGIIYLNKGIKKEHINDKLILIGFGCFIITQVGFVLTGFLSDFLIQGTLIDYNFYGDFENLINPVLYVVLARVRNFWFILGTIFIFSTFEKIVKRTKYILTALYSVITLLLIILPIEIADILYLYSVAIISIFIIYIIFYLYTKWSQIEFKSITAFFSFALILMLVGNNLTANVIRGYFDELIISRIVYLYAGPILSLMGFLIMIIPAVTDPDVISRAFRYWIIFGISIGVVVGFQLFTSINIGFIELVIAYIIGVGFYLVVVYKIIKHIRHEIQTEKSEKNILKMFSKPQEITIKDITHSKEHMICLVCKGNISKLNIFTCKKCAVLYCQNCIRILSDLENACWVCNTPFTKKKPSKPYRKEEQKEEIKITGEVHPKKLEGNKLK